MRPDRQTPRRARPRRFSALGLAAAVLLAAIGLVAQSRSDSYTVYTANGRTSLSFHAGHDTDMVPLDQVAKLFNLSVSEDSLAGGFVLRGRGQTILLISGQALASVGPGRIVTLPAPFERQRSVWQVPIEFVRVVLGPALNTRVDVRRAARTMLVGDVRLPQLVGRFERQGPNARLVLEIQPAAPHKVTRQDGRVSIQFDAVALDVTPVTGVIKEFATAVRVSGSSLVIDLGPATDTYRATDLDATHLAIDLLAAPPPPPPVQAAAQEPAPATAAAPPAPRPIIDSAPGRLRTIVLDPGHGGEDAGVSSPDGTKEKDYVLQVARRLKATIEGRLGVRVILTRDGDTAVPLDRRASIANNNKADVLISLHANSARRPTVAGVHVLSLRLEDYAARQGAAGGGEVPVAFVGGGTRQIEVLPWDLAQVGFTRPSATIAGLLHEHLVEQHVPVFARPTSSLPLRPLVGASMPAILVELGFLTTPDDEADLKTPNRTQRTIEAIMSTLADIKDGVPNDAPAPR